MTRTTTLPNGRNILIITNQNAKLREGVLRFPKAFNGFELKLKCSARENFAGFNQVRFIPKQGYIIAEVVYSISMNDQILKKVFPTAYANGIEGVVLHPVRVNVASI